MDTGHSDSGGLTEPDIPVRVQVRSLDLTVCWDAGTVTFDGVDEESEIGLAVLSGHETSVSRFVMGVRDADRLDAFPTASTFQHGIESTVAALAWRFEPPEWLEGADQMRRTEAERVAFEQMVRGLPYAAKVILARSSRHKFRLLLSRFASPTDCL